MLAERSQKLKNPSLSKLCPFVMTATLMGPLPHCPWASSEAEPTAIVIAKANHTDFLEIVLMSSPANLTN